MREEPISESKEGADRESVPTVDAAKPDPVMKEEKKVERPELSLEQEIEQLKFRIYRQEWIMSRVAAASIGGQRYARILSQFEHHVGEIENKAKVEKYEEEENE